MTGSTPDEIVYPTIGSNTATWLLTDGSEFAAKMNAIGDAQPPAAPGVYVFCKHDKTSLVALYIGETDDLARTLTGDLCWQRNWRDVLAAGAEFVCYAYVSLRSERLRFKHGLVRLLRPSLSGGATVLKSVL